MKNAYVYAIHDAPAEPGCEYVARAVRAAASQLNPRVVMSFEGIASLRSLRRLQPADEAAEAAEGKMQRAAFKAYRGRGGNASAQRYAVGAMKRNVARAFTFVTEVRVVECASYADPDTTELRILGLDVPVRVVRAPDRGKPIERAQRERAQRERAQRAFLYTPSDLSELRELREPIELREPSDRSEQSKARSSSFEELVAELLATAYEPDAAWATSS